jgi:hypothetical protein
VSGELFIIGSRFGAMFDPTWLKVDVDSVCNVYHQLIDFVEVKVGKIESFGRG